jgi:hypothetical protein
LIAVLHLLVSQPVTMFSAIDLPAVPTHGRQNSLSSAVVVNTLATGLD